MSTTRRPTVYADMTVSADGFAGGLEHLGPGFGRIIGWVHETRAFRERFGVEGGEEGPGSDLMAAKFARAGAYVMGRTMFDTGEFNWGHRPPFQAPVFVVTNRPRPPLERIDTTFTFVPDIATALEQATAACGDRDVHVSGGPTLLGQVLAAGRLDELILSVAPVLLGSGMPLFARRLPRYIEMEAIDVVVGPHATHTRYRIVHPSLPCQAA
jgi:dihydrofolate reductase